ncbi:helix-turn-helix domain-containing protein [Euzebyella saccharophila]|uniref:Helix-turn-helix domain-containing protein n=1 Tax=Euzebyella saccharophila TaxID=679664 RepID=A0ABV8JTE8_9FLAO|nr:helix-turn-helix domain-containing protein [Euzebyella saccharophila]
MKFRLNYNPKELSQKVIAKELNKLGISHSFTDNGLLVLTDSISKKLKEDLDNVIAGYGIQLTEAGKSNIVGDIKKAIDELIYSQNMRKKTVSAYLTERLGYTYSYLSNLFSEETYTSIENFIILRKIEYAKKLILQGDMSLTEIAHQLDYSSVAHLSGQFKKVTGLTPTTFLRILERRKTENT